MRGPVKDNVECFFWLIGLEINIELRIPRLPPRDFFLRKMKPKENWFRNKSQNDANG